MKLKDINEIAKKIEESTSKDSLVDLKIELNSDEYESIQQEVYRHINKTTLGYKSMRKFEVIIGDIRFKVKRK